MASRNPLSEDEVANLFAGKAPPPPAVQLTPQPVGSWRPHYDRCDHCRVIQPCLVTFRGPDDWPNDFERDDPIRDNVRRLRQSVGTRVVQLCFPCIEKLQVPRQVPLDDELAPRLFAV